MNIIICAKTGLRVLLACVESHANRYGRHIVPIAAFSIDFYVRVFLRVRESKLEVKQSAGKLALVFQSAGTDSYYLQVRAIIVFSFDRMTEYSINLII